MRIQSFLAYISLPTLFAVAGFSRQLFSSEVLIMLLQSFVFYTAPYLLWAVIVAITRPSQAITHAGYIANTIALLSIASFWLFPRDPSGLPIQWMLYWPLAIVTLILGAGGMAIYQRINSPNSSFKRDDQSRPLI